MADREETAPEGVEADTGAKPKGSRRTPIKKGQVFTVQRGKACSTRIGWLSEGKKVRLEILDGGEKTAHVLIEKGIIK